VARSPSTAPDLLRSIGLLADGPVRWGSAVPARAAGLYVVELGSPLAVAPLELTRVGKWLERLPDLRLDGARPTSKALASRIASLWWPDSPVLFAGATERSIGRRVAGLIAHVVGDRQPHPDGQWLHLLRPLEALGARFWWAVTDAPEEYLDALFDAFADGRGAAASRPAGALPLPWANTRRPTGERQSHGITGGVVPAPPRVPEPPRRVVDLPPGDADGARLEDRATGTTRRAPQTLARARAAAGAAPRRTATRTSAASPQAPEPVHLSAAAHERVRTELDELTQVRRREVVSRIKAARELGDLRENADYTAAREEQSFLEGRIQALEDRLRRAVVVEDAAPTGRVIVGSTVTVETGGDELRYTIVGVTESDVAAGRLSSASPVGAALLGASAGVEVEVRTPRGPVLYRVLAVD
jgi:transcription elongation factor GreA